MPIDKGKVLVRDEPIASIIQEALEGFASGRFQSQAEVRRFIEGHPGYPTSKRGMVRNTLVPELLTNPVYAGYVERPQWSISLRQGQHEGLISLATFQRIQERLNSKARIPIRPDISADFPLRGAVACGCCERPMTSCWSKSKTGVKHAYYLCVTKGCEPGQNPFGATSWKVILKVF
ncbi:recombinase family protein [Devosia sp. YIM 151766]|uniref:recombinase family protein n=1 Tax=Devosia sp. YIM 151766 TaxID=3017325 RepID=UPI00255D138B|nr:recombinase zinc beta ribbon domain-containing protein [Devosia sp. YIM 151766]WIY52061.1 recombinase family protein [Devosia sp. YIM 151766]